MLVLQTISNTPRDYPWGSRTLLAALEGRAPAAGPEAEVWFGDHPGCPARTADGRTLDLALAEAGAEPLPYLLKLLAAASPLSIQVHPSLEQARAGFAAESGLAADDPARNYRDANHKPEMIVALGERFEALCGLRELAATRRYVDALGTAPGVVELRSRLEGADDAAVLRDVIAWLLSGAAAATVADVEAALAAADDAEFAAELDAARRIAGFYPGDPGLVVAMLMNFVVLAPGEAVFLRAGLLHAYLDGIGVEIMAASDNVLRGGLTSKRVDVAELLTLLDTTPAPVEIRRPAAVDAVADYGPGIDDFRLALARPVTDPVAIAVEGATTVLVTAGRARVATETGEVDLAPGQAAIAVDEPSGLRVTALDPDVPTEVFIAAPGR